MTDIDMSRLIGFDQLGLADGDDLDLKSGAFGARLGAKRADVEPVAPAATEDDRAARG